MSTFGNIHTTKAKNVNEGGYLGGQKKPKILSTYTVDFLILGYEILVC